MRKNQEKASDENAVQRDAILQDAILQDTLRQDLHEQNTLPQDTFQNATGKIDYTLMNDYIFHAVLQTNEKVLRGLVGALLHLKAEEIKAVTILNPIELGKYYGEKYFTLDIKVILNNEKIINLEMQVRNQDFWNDRSLIYLCSIFRSLKRSEDYSQIKPAYHIGIVNFTPFPEFPEFYATNMMTNQKYHYIYNDKFTLNVLDLTQIHLATEEDKAWKLDYWAKLFKSTTWEDFNMLAQQDDFFSEAIEAVYNLNRDEQARYICEMLEDGERIMLTYTNRIARLEAAVADKDNALADKDAVIAEMAAEMAALKAQLATAAH